MRLQANRLPTRGIRESLASHIGSGRLRGRPVAKMADHSSASSAADPQAPSLRVHYVRKDAQYKVNSRLEIPLAGEAKALHARRCACCAAHESCVKWGASSAGRLGPTAPFPTNLSRGGACTSGVMQCPRTGRGRCSPAGELGTLRHCSAPGRAPLHAQAARGSSTA